MTPDPIDWPWRSSSGGRSKKWGNAGSRKCGLSSLPRPWPEMLTTPGVTSRTSGASVGTFPSLTSGMCARAVRAGLRQQMIDNTKGKRRAMPDMMTTILMAPPMERAVQERCFLADWPLVDTAGPLVQTSAVIVKKSLPEHSSSVRLRDGGFLLPALRVWEADQSRAPCRCGQRHAIRGPLRIVQWSSADIFAQTPISGLLAAPRVRQEAARSLGNTAGVLRAPQ